MADNRKTVSFGSVQHDYITRLRAHLLKSGRVPTYDLSFTEGANLAVVIAMAFHHADEYLDREGLHGEMPQDTAAAQIASDYLVDGDLPVFIKGNFGTYAEYFADQIVMCALADEPGVPDKEWWDKASVDREEFHDAHFTAEPPEQ